MDFAKERKDWNVPSGDDMFFLDYLLKKDKKEVQIVESKSLEVVTKAHDDVSLSLAQRRRWFGKTALLKNPTASRVGFFVLLIQLFYFGGTFVSLLQGQLVLALALFCIKAILDAFLMSKETIHFKYLPWMVLFEIFYPVYLVVLLFTINKNYEWKGRNIKSPSNDGLF